LTRPVIGERNREWELRIKQMPLGVDPLSPIPPNPAAQSNIRAAIGARWWPPLFCGSAAVRQCRLIRSGAAARHVRVVANRLKHADSPLELRGKHPKGVLAEFDQLIRHYKLGNGYSSVS
jgi:hypothetical protein